MTTEKKPKPQRITTPAPELPNEPEEQELDIEKMSETLTHVERVVAALVDPLQKIAEAMQRAAVAQAQIRDIHMSRENQRIAKEQDEEIQRLEAGHLTGSTIDPMRDGQ